MKVLGIIVVLIGLLITVYTGFGFITKETGININKIEITRNQGTGLVWSPLIGALIIALGSAILIFVPKKDI